MGIEPDMLSDKRVGLVLGGGGAKGAYQIGVWKALREKGFAKFDVIAGTSVGALNGALVANGDVAAAERVWREIEFPRWEPRLIGMLVTAYAVLFGPLIVAALSLVLGVIVELTSGDAGLAWWLSVVSLYSAVTSLGIGSWVIIFASQRKPFILIEAPILLIASIPTFMGSMILTSSTRFDASPWSWIFPLAAFPIGFLFAVPGLSCQAIFQRSGQLFSGAAIVGAIERNLDLDRMRRNVSAVFVTMARGHSGWDPFRPNFRRVEPGWREVDMEQPHTLDVWVAEYVDLCSVRDQHKAVEILRLSGALPWVFNSGSQAEQMVVDGGLADNLPILPVLLASLDLIVIVSLTPRSKMTLQILQDQLDALWRRQALPQLSDDEIVSLYRDLVRNRASTVIPDGPQLRGNNIFVFAPEKPLAQWKMFPFLTGTMNFRSHVMEEWLQRGYDETIQHWSHRNLPNS
jgi:predicted acylesterase/phospholipase RssA